MSCIAESSAPWAFGDTNSLWWLGLGIAAGREVVRAGGGWGELFVCWLGSYGGGGGCGSSRGEGRECVGVCGDVATGCVGGLRDPASGEEQEKSATGGGHGRAFCRRLAQVHQGSRGVAAGAVWASRQRFHRQDSHSQYHLPRRAGGVCPFFQSARIGPEPERGR